MDIPALEKQFDLTIGLAAWPLSDPGAAVMAAADTPVPAASTIKLYILAALLDSRGLEGNLTMTAEDQVGGSGVLNSLTPGRSWAVRDLATLMIIVSDNTATNLLIDCLGVEFINDWIRGQGFTGTNLVGKLMMPGRRVSSHTTPQDLARCMARLWTGELLNAQATEEARTILSRQHYRDALGRELDFDPFTDEPGVQIASKSGSIVGVRNEVAVIGLEGKEYVMAVMTSGSKDSRFWPDNPGLRAISRVNALLFRRFLQGAA